jgi:hypothetical protein
MAEALTGGLVNYYLAPVHNPQRADQPAYTAECEDITEALQMTPEEFCEFKAIWRTAAARLGNGKAGTKALYDAEKRVHYAQRDVRKYQREGGIPLPAVTVEEPKDKAYFLLDGEYLDQGQWWMEELQDGDRTTREYRRAVAVALRVLKHVLPL